MKSLWHKVKHLLGVQGFEFVGITRRLLSGFLLRLWNQAMQLESYDLLPRMWNGQNCLRKRGRRRGARDMGIRSVKSGHALYRSGISGSQEWISLCKPSQGERQGFATTAVNRDTEWPCG